MGAGLGANPSANVALGALDWSMSMGAPPQAAGAGGVYGGGGGMGMGPSGFGGGGGGAVNPFASPAPGSGFGGHDPFAASPQQQQPKPAASQGGMSFNPFE